MLRLCYFTICMLFLFSGSALAYIDPASTSTLIQVVAALFAAGGAVIAVYWKRIQMFFRKRKQKKLDAERAAQLRQEEARDAGGDASKDA